MRMFHNFFLLLFALCPKAPLQFRGARGQVTNHSRARPPYCFGQTKVNPSIIIIIIIKQPSARKHSDIQVRSLQAPCSFAHDVSR